MATIPNNTPGYSSGVRNFFSSLGDWFNWISQIAYNIPFIGESLLTGFQQIASYCYQLGYVFDDFINYVGQVIDNLNSLWNGNIIFSILQTVWYEITSIKNNPMGWIDGKLLYLIPDYYTLKISPQGWVIGQIQKLFPQFTNFFNNPIGFILSQWYQNFPESYVWIFNPEQRFSSLIQSLFPALYQFYLNPIGYLLSLFYQNYPVLYVFITNPNQSINNLLDINFPELRLLLNNPSQWVYLKITNFIDSQFESFVDAMVILVTRILNFLWLR